MLVSWEDDRQEGAADDSGISICLTFFYSFFLCCCYASIYLDLVGLQKHGGSCIILLSLLKL